MNSCTFSSRSIIAILSLLVANNNNLRLVSGFLPGIEKFTPVSDLSTVQILPPVSSQQIQEETIQQHYNNEEVLVVSPPGTVATSITSIIEEDIGTSKEEKENEFLTQNEYPFASMISGCAPFIASHVGQIVVFHIPGEIVNRKDHFYDTLLSDISLTWLMGMKIVIVVDTTSQQQQQQKQQQRRGILEEECLLVDNDNDNQNECYNLLRMIENGTIRQVEKEASFVRFETERKLNKYLRLHGGSFASSTSPDVTPAIDGNVVGGNFYSAKSYGSIFQSSSSSSSAHSSSTSNGKLKKDAFQYTGFANHIKTSNIKQVLNNNDVVLLTTIGTSPYGDLVKVDGNQLAAKVAASLGAYKVIYVAHQDSVLCQTSTAATTTTSSSKKKGTSNNDDHDNTDDVGPSTSNNNIITTKTTTTKKTTKPLQEIPLSFAKEFIEYHNIRVQRKTGFMLIGNGSNNVEQQQTPLSSQSYAMEMLIHLGWSSWAIENGVQRAHIVNPRDGALLEELFTSKNGENTCLYHDDENNKNDDDDNDLFEDEDWFNFFFTSQAATAVG